VFIDLVDSGDESGGNDGVDSGQHGGINSVQHGGEDSRDHGGDDSGDDSKASVPLFCGEFDTELLLNLLLNFRTP
jgi:hypothetical protein